MTIPPRGRRSRRRIVGSGEVLSLTVAPTVLGLVLAGRECGRRSHPPRGCINTTDRPRTEKSAAGAAANPRGDRVMPTRTRTGSPRWRSANGRWFRGGRNPVGDRSRGWREGGRPQWPGVRSDGAARREGIRDPLQGSGIRGHSTETAAARSLLCHRNEVRPAGSNGISRTKSSLSALNRMPTTSTR